MSSKFKDLIKKLLATVPLVDGVFRRFIWSRIAYPEVEMKLLSNLESGSINIAVDIGSALGSYSWILQSKSKKVFAFEPGVVHFRYLNRVTFFTNIHAINCAVGATNERVTMYTPGNDEEARHTATISSENPVAGVSDAIQTQVEQVSLDAFFESEIEEGDSIDLVKIDVEGYELPVLQGGRRLIDAFYPIIICEIEWRHNNTCEEVFEFLFELGYECEYFSNGNFNKLLTSDITFLQKEEDLVDRLAGKVSPAENRYVNNFVFRHPRTSVRL